MTIEPIHNDEDLRLHDGLKIPYESLMAGVQ
jgi:hypothetical protein